MKKILTLILDGFGYRTNEEGNAIINANPVNFNEAFKKYPHAILKASGEAIGLDHNQFGNSEIGHMTIGAGRVIIPPKQLVDAFLTTNPNPKLDSMIEDAVTNNKRVHLMGLCSDGYVHTDIEHLFKVYLQLVKNGVKEIYFHLITDGRDTKTEEFLKYYEQVVALINEYKVGTIATICGRYYAMDRDHNWDRTREYYNLICYGEGIPTKDIPKTIKELYRNKITDEFMKPIIVDKKGLINNDDILFWYNYRTDRAKQILGSFVEKDFKEFRTINLNNLDIYTFVTIDKKIKTNVLIENSNLENTLGLYLSQLGLSQARIAETEKYAHVTFFFDGEYNGAIENCDRFLIPSPDVATFDKKPEMSIVKVTKKTIACMEEDYDFILCNFANPDMVGHTGNFDAATKAIMAVDICLAKLLEKAEDNFYTVIILADHGNADTMLNDDGSPCTTHSISDVPFIITDNKVKLKETGSLANVAPTILEYMDIAIPKEMKDTESLILDED